MRWYGYYLLGLIVAELFLIWFVLLLIAGKM